MIKTTVLIPVRDNNGRRFPTELRRTLEARFLRFGGFTCEAGIEGAWEQHGRIYRDRSYQYIVSLASWNDFPAWLEDVHWARKAFQQEALYIEVAGTTEVIAGSDDLALD